MQKSTDRRAETARAPETTLVVDHFDGWDVPSTGAVQPCTGWSCVTRAEDRM